MSILTICPSYGRPSMLRGMLQSFSKTITENTRMVVVLDEKDLCYSENKDVCSHHQTTVFVVNSLNITECFNKVFTAFPNYDYYHLTNDDVIYHTPGWDKVLAYPLKISYGDDGYHGRNLCTFPMIDGKIVRALGWLQMPALVKYYGDMVWKDIGNTLNCLRYVDDVSVEHYHWVNNKRPMINEDNYHAIYKKDTVSYLEWLETRFNNDVIRIGEALDGHNTNSLVS